MPHGPDEPVSVWRERHTIRAGETDATRHATPTALCDLFQEVAGNHAWTLGVALDQIVDAHRETWMLYRLALRLHAPPRWRDVVTVETWPCGVERIYAVRDFRVSDEAGRTLAEASTSWLIVDLEGRRPSRAPRTRLDWNANVPRVLPEAFQRRLPAPDGEAHAVEFDVRRSDIDRNGHVNHTRMLAWVLDGAPGPHHDGTRVTSLDAEFLAEALPGERVRVSSAPDDAGGSWRHAVTRPADGRLLLKARTAWVPTADVQKHA